MPCKPERLTEAFELLKQVALEFNVDVPTLRDKGPGSRYAQYVAARAEVCKRGRALKITVIDLGIALNRDHTTVTYHASVVMQATKRERRKWSREQAARRRELRRLEREEGWRDQHALRRAEKSSECTAPA